MKNKHVIESFHKIAPSEAAKERILNKTFERYLSEESSSKKVFDMKKTFSWKRLAPVAACLVVAVAISIPFLNNTGSGDFMLSNSDKGIKVSYTDKLPEGEPLNGELVELTEEQLYANTQFGHPVAAFAGTVKDYKFVDVDFGGWQYDSTWTIYNIEVEKTLRGDAKPGDIVTVLITAPAYSVDSIWGGFRLDIGDKGMFMPMNNDVNSTYSANGKTLCLLDLAQYAIQDSRYMQLAQDQAVLDNIIQEVEAKIAQYN
ncbi:hypothetical protein [Lutispora saccharofermentans]|uniref:DUF4179 domain-containing protein n=1 Tax=Lutispora saccharofermentans TaxID=3024236 RepID=A0ABT1NAP9_9FIRM|nr:hypothetical protein [Lutispora saccharofermentans]MCQ1528323.1 hypothetical protein [Lutispora saccharofermentans]